MIDLMNNYIHGYVLTPVLISLKKKKFFIKNTELSDFKSINAVNQGFMQAALNMLEVLSYVTKVNNNYTVTTSKNVLELIEDWPEELINLYNMPIKSFVSEDNYSKSIMSIINGTISTYKRHINFSDAKFMLGAFIVPLFIGLKMYNKDKKSNSLKNLLDFQSNDYLKPYIDLLLLTNMIDQSENELNFIGKFMLERAFNMATACSYKPMLYNIDKVLFGNYNEVLSTDSHGNERHIDRTLNVLGSGFQHQGYFKDYMQIIHDIFDSDEISSQPKYVVDMGCGDGALLEKVYNIIKHNTKRGQHLNEYPIKLIGADLNGKSLESTKVRFYKSGIDIITVQADITNPQDLVNSIKSLGISDIENCIHIRSFLDHEIQYALLKTNYEVINNSCNEIFIDKQGNLIPSDLIYETLSNHFRRWSEIITKYGIIIMEVHSLDLKTISQYLIETESLHFDFLQACSFQYLVSADMFTICAASAGLLPDFKYFKKYPQLLPYTRIQTNYFIKTNYSIVNLKAKDAVQVYYVYKDLINKYGFTEEQFIQGIQEKVLHVFVAQNLNGENLGIICAKDLDKNKDLSILFIKVKDTVKEFEHIGYDLTRFFLHIQLLKNQVDTILFKDFNYNIDNNPAEMDRFAHYVLGHCYK